MRLAFKRLKTSPKTMVSATARGLSGAIGFPASRSCWVNANRECPLLETRPWNNGHGHWFQRREVWNQRNPATFWFRKLWKHLQLFGCFSQMLHVWNMYLQNWVIFRVNVGKYSSTMECLGLFNQISLESFGEKHPDFSIRKRRGKDTGNICGRGNPGNPGVLESRPGSANSMLNSHKKQKTTTGFTSRWRNLDLKKFQPEFSKLMTFITHDGSGWCW